MENPAQPQAGADDYALEMKHITKQFPGVRALNDVTIRVKRGQVHALLGENGAGKSTLMKILDGVYPSGTYQGEIVLDGARLELRSPHDARLKGIGFVPQEITVIESLSVAENIYVGNLTRGGKVVNFRDLYQKAERFLKERGIRLDARQSVATLTAHQRQLVMIARALSTNPSVLILDEPTSSLTHDETDILLNAVRDLQTQGVTTLFITHKMEELFALSDHITVMRDGAVVADFDRADFDQNTLITAMVGRKIDTLYPAIQAQLGDELLRVEDLTVPHPRIARRNVVEKVSFSLRRGEVLGIGGLVGSGRSEVVNAIYGRLPHTGRIFVKGQPVNIRRPQDAKRQGIALLTEDRKQDGLLFNFAIRENITLNSLPAVSHGQVLSRRSEERYADEYINTLSIRAPSASTMVSSLSGGNQQKVVLAKALMSSPQVLLLDEPTKGVDVGAKAEIYKLIASLAEAGMGLILISSELPELLGMCDRFIVLFSGRVVDRFSKEEASDERVMRAATGGEAAPSVERDKS